MGAFWFSSTVLWTSITELKSVGFSKFWNFTWINNVNSFRQLLVTLVTNSHPFSMFSLGLDYQGYKKMMKWMPIVTWIKLRVFVQKKPWYFNCDVFDFSKWEIFLVIRSIVSWTNWTALLYHIGQEITRPLWPRHFSCYIQIFEMTDLLVSSIAHRLITTWLSYLPGGVGWGCSSTCRNYSFRYREIHYSK